MEAGEIGREEGRWICEPSPAPPPPPLAPPGAVHSCDDLFVEAAAKNIGEIRGAERKRRPANE